MTTAPPNTMPGHDGKDVDTGSDGFSPDGGGENVVNNKRSSYPKTDESREAVAGDDAPSKKSPVLFWMVVMVKLFLDIATTIIAFRAIRAESDCCGEPNPVGVYPMLLAAAFVVLIFVELAILIRAIVLTRRSNSPRIKEQAIENSEDLENEEAEEENNSIEIVLEEDKNGRPVTGRICCWLPWKAGILMHVLDSLVVLNPFFGCGIVWVIMIQADQGDVFIVLGLQGGSLFLHYISVYLVRPIPNAWEFFKRVLAPLAPFFCAVFLVLFYLRQGGVCYVVEDNAFKFTGCEVCANGYPPVDGICHLENGSSYTFVPTDPPYQASYCALQNPTGPDTDFCFFDNDHGKFSGVAAERRTEAPTSLSTDR